MSVSVGLLGHNGLVGSALLPHLLNAHTKGALKLVILRREGSDLSRIPGEIENRVVDLSESGEKVNVEAVRGLDVVISAVGSKGISSQTYLIDALAFAGDIKAFLHSDFGCNWTPEELAIPGLAVIATKEKVVEHAQHKGVPITNIRVGGFDKFVFGFGAGGADIKGNKIQLYKDSLKYPLRITTLDFLGYAITSLLTSIPPSSIANKTYQVYDLTPTGQDFIDALTSIHDVPTEVSQLSQEEWEAGLKTPLAIVSGIKRKWGENDWGAAEPKVDVSGWEGEGMSFEETLKAWLH